MQEAMERILIVDDSDSDREACKRYLSSRQQDVAKEFEFIDAICGEDGLKAFNNANPSCVLLDYNLPDMDGLTVLS